MKEKNNIIRFPIEKRWDKIDLMKRFASREKRELEKKQVAISASLVSVLLIMAVANSNFLNSKEPVQVDKSRGIASFDSSTTTNVRNIEWENRLAKQLSNMSIRSTASLSHKPNQKDKLQFGELEGKYFLGYQSGKINEIRFSPNDKKMDPKYINDRVHFINKYRDLLAVSFSDVKKTNLKQNEMFREEKYTLTDGLKNVGDIHFRLDKFGRLIDMKVHSH